MNEDKISNISELAEIFTKSHKLKDEIKKGLGVIGYEL